MRIVRTSRPAILLGLVVALALLLSGRPAYSASFKPIILDPSYDHTKYAPQCSDQDILRKFRAYTTCFDGPDDDDGDGLPDKWAVPHWVAYEIKRYPGVLGKAPSDHLDGSQTKICLHRALRPAMTRTDFSGGPTST